MKFVFTVTVDVQRRQGRFSTRESLASELREALEGADPGDLTGDGDDAEYGVESWDVSGED